MREKFTWGKVIARFSYDFDGKEMELTKFHPWKVVDRRVMTGDPDPEVIEFHCEEMHESFHSVEAAVIAWIARQSLGTNQHMLVAGLCRALEIK